MMNRIRNKTRVPILRPLIWAYAALWLSCSQKNYHISEPIEAFTKKESISFENQIIPKNLLSDTKLLPIFEVVRRRAELRTGPGLEFPLKGRLLSKKDLIVRIYKHKYWTKVIDTQSGEIGWIHVKTTKPYKGNLKKITVKTSSLQNVFVTKNLNQIFDFKSKTPIEVKLKKGQILKVLNKERAYVLVYIPSNNSVAWVERRHIK